MSEVTNADLYGVLMDIREDLGGLKSSSKLQSEAIADHTVRIGTLEMAGAKQRGVVGVWGLIAAGSATMAAAAVQFFRGH